MVGITQSTDRRRTIEVLPMVVEKPAIEEVGGESILVVHAAAILPELFP